MYIFQFVFVKYNLNKHATKYYKYCIIKNNTKRQIEQIFIDINNAQLKKKDKNKKRNLKTNIGGGDPLRLLLVYTHINKAKHKDYQYKKISSLKLKLK